MDGVAEVLPQQAQPIDYDALANQARTEKPAQTAALTQTVAATPPPTPRPRSTKPTIDYDALANQARQARPSVADTMVIASPSGLIRPGNISIWNRPTVQNADGSHSTEYSTSFTDSQGHEVLVPTIVNGKFLTPDGKKPPEGSPAEKTMFKQAWQHYLKTGENLGVFDNAANADAYAGQLHNRGSRPTAQISIGATSSSAGAAAPSSSVDLTSNPRREGTYSFQTSDGKEIQVPYSKALELLGHPEGALGSGQSEIDRYHHAVVDTQSRGYTLAQEDIARLYHDYAADPNLKSVRWENFKKSVPAIQTAIGFGKEAAKTAVGLHDIAAGKPAAGEPKSALRQFAEAPLEGGYQKLGGGAEVGAEVIAPEAVIGKAAGAVKGAEAAREAAAAAKAAHPVAAGIASAAGHAALAGGEMGGQTYVKTGGDIEQAKQATEMGAAVGGGTAAASEAAGAGNQFLKNLLRHRLDIDEFETEKLVKATQDANQKIDVQAAKIHDQNVSAVQKARNAGQAADAARLEHQDVVNNQQAVEAKRQNLTDAAEKARAAVQQRLQTIQGAARSYFGQAYGDLEKAAGGKGVNYSTLADGVHEALQKVKGSAESTRVFKDILSRAKGVEEAQAAEGFSLEDLANLAPDERQQLLSHLEEGGEEGAGGATLAHLNGYYSELGRALNSSATPGDVKQAVGVLRDFIDGQIKQELGPELYAKNQLIRSQYRRYAEGWKEYGGVAGSGSPVAMALQAKDPYNATRPFIGQVPEEASRAQEIIVGKAGDPAEQFLPKNVVDAAGNSVPSWRYRKQTSQIINHLRNLEGGLDALPKAEKLQAETDSSASRLADARSLARETTNPDLIPAPAAQTLTPTELREAKAAALHQAAHNLGKFGLWVGIGGLAGGVGTFLKTGDLKKGLEVIGGGVAAGLLTPYMASRLLDQPGVVKSLTELSRGDLQQLMKLPADQRGDVEGVIKQLADEATRSGRLRAEQIPWLRVIGGEAGRGKAGEEAARKQAATEAAAKSPLPEGQYLPTPALPDLNRIDSQIGAPK